MNQSGLEQIHEAGAERGKTRASQSPLALVLIGYVMAQDFL